MNVRTTHRRQRQEASERDGDGRNIEGKRERERVSGVLVTGRGTEGEHFL